jgi:hypothetical protein
MARSRHERARGSVEKEGEKWCQGEAPEHDEEVWLGGWSRGLVPYCEPAALSADRWRRGGFLLRSLGASSARVWEGEVCGEGGGLIATRGRRNRNETGWISSRRSRRRRASSSDGGWRRHWRWRVGPACQRGKQGRGYRFGWGFLAGPWAVSPSGPKGFPRPFNEIPFSFSISFLFFPFVIFAKHFQNDFKQLLKLVIHFPSVCWSSGKH